MTGASSLGSRPVCPVRRPLSKNVRFFPSAAAAERAGFRPCLRCRPETAPFCPAWKGTRATVDRAVRLIVEEGALDNEGASVEGLAERLGVGARQLSRLFARHLNATSIQGSKDSAGSAGQALARPHRPADDRNSHAGRLSQPSPFQRCLRRGLPEIANPSPTFCHGKRAGSKSRRAYICPTTETFSPLQARLC